MGACTSTAPASLRSALTPYAAGGTGSGGIDGRGAVGAFFGDYDADGDPDLFLSRDGPDRLYRNDGAGAFTEVTAARPASPLRRGRPRGVSAKGSAVDLAPPEPPDPPQITRNHTSPAAPRPSCSPPPALSSP